MQFLIIIVVLFALMWFLLIRPQKRRQVVHSQMLQELHEGDEIVTAGGLYGTVRGVEDEELLVEIAPGTNVRLAKKAVASVTRPEDAVVELEEGAEEVESTDGSAR